MDYWNDRYPDDPKAWSEWTKCEVVDHREIWEIEQRTDAGELSRKTTLRLLNTIRFLHHCIEIMSREALVMQLKNMSYSEYLKTPYWASLREHMIERAKGRCQLCNSDKHLNVHHRTYENLGEENPEDLTVLCRPCHAKFHDKMP